MDYAKGNVELSHIQVANRMIGTLDQHHDFFCKCLFDELLPMATKSSYKRTPRLQISKDASCLFEQLYYLTKRISLIYYITEKQKQNHFNIHFLFISFFLLNLRLLFSINFIFKY